MSLWLVYPNMMINCYIYFMKKTRQQVFETNSSSTHSISISKLNDNDILDVLIPDEDGNIVLHGGEFGWELETYNDAQSKASYAAIYVMQWAREDSENFKEILIDIIKEQTGCNEVIFDFSSKYNDESGKEWAYIDHQSVEDKDLHYMFEDPSKLRNFIFNKQSVLETDNDNH